MRPLTEIITCACIVGGITVTSVNLTVVEIIAGSSFALMGVGWMAVVAQDDIVEHVLDDHERPLERVPLWSEDNPSPLPQRRGERLFFCYLFGLLKLLSP